MVLFKKFDRSGDGYLNVRELFVIKFIKFNIYIIQEMLARIEISITELEV